MSEQGWHTATGWPAPARRRLLPARPWRGGSRGDVSWGGVRAGAVERWKAALAVLAGMALYAVVAPVLLGVGDSRLVDLGRGLVGPSTTNWFGTDLLGRDLLVRSAQGLRISLALAAVSAVSATVIGTAVGVVAGATGGWFDKLVMRVVDGINAVPHLLLGVVIAALWRGQWAAIVASIALTHWTQVARIVRAETLAVNTGDHVAAAVASGSTRAQVWVTHLVPAVVPQAAVAVVLMLPHAVWHEAALSFLGIGLPPTAPSLGTLLADARAGVLLGAWWLLVFPGGLLVAACLAIGSVGAHARRLASPRQATEAAVTR